MYVDHKFGNTMDDRIESLQLLSQGDNTRRSLKCQGKVPYRGIDEHRNAFQTRLGVEGERFYLGRYKSDLEAAAAYEYAAEFATNGIWVKPEYYNQLPTPPHKNVRNERLEAFVTNSFIGMENMIFNNENDVRQWILNVFPSTSFIEFAHGGTSGFPDCIIPLYGILVPVELKSSRKTAPSKLLRPSQRRIFDMWSSMRIAAFVLVGIKKTNDIHVTNYLTKRTLSTSEPSTFRTWLEEQINFSLRNRQ